MDGVGEIRFGTGFSGCDAVAYAARTNPRLARWRHVLSAETEKTACAVLAERCPDVPNLGDVFQAGGDGTNVKYEVDVMVVGPPCVAFSKLGRRRGKADSRSWAFQESLRFCRRFGSRIVIVENVPDVANSARFAKFFDNAKRILEEFGYFTKWRELCPTMFGARMRRPRLYLVGALGDRRAARAILADLIPGRGEAGDGRAEGSEGGLGGVPAGGRGREPLFWSSNYGLNTSEGVCPTLARNGRFNVGTFMEDGEGKLFPRILAAGEAERLMGFPGDWTAVAHPGGKRPLSEAERYRLIGNSMSIDVLDYLLERTDQVLRRDGAAAVMGDESTPYYVEGNHGGERRPTAEEVSFMEKDQHVGSFLSEVAPDGPVAAPDGHGGPQEGLDTPVMTDETTPYYIERNRGGERRPTSGHEEIDALAAIRHLDLHDFSLIGLYFVVRSMFTERGLRLDEDLEFNLGDLKDFTTHKTGLSRKLKRLQDLGLVDYRPAKGRTKSHLRLLPCRIEQPAAN